MIVSCKGQAVIRHSTTGQEYIIDSEELDWEAVGGDERDMGAETHYEATIDHPDLGVLSWGLWEYPSGIQNNKRTVVNGHTLIADVDYWLARDRDEEERSYYESLDAEDRQNEVDALVEWFHENYEDPAERTPYESAEGGYQWIWGGPFDAREVLSDAYPRVPEYIIDAAVAEIEKDGLLDWAPVPNPGDYASDEDFDENDVDEDPSIPTQEPGMGFALQSTGLIGSVATGIPRPEEEQEIAELREVAFQALVSLVDGLRGSNAYGPLLPAATYYQSIISAQSLSIDRLYAAGVRLESSANRIALEVEAGELPSLPMLLGEALDTVLALHGPLLLSTERGRVLLDNSRKYAGSQFEAAAYRAAADELVSKIAQSGLLDASAAESLAVANGPSDDKHPERSAQIAHTANRNLLIVLAKTAFGIGVATIVGNGIGLSIPGVIATEAVATVTNGAYSFLIHNANVLHQFVAAAGADMSWMTAILRRVKASLAFYL
jgi:hypothetical protein